MIQYTRSKELDEVAGKPSTEDAKADDIGGYFELALPDFGDPYPAPFIKYQSGRAALRAVLEASSLTRVLLPAYMCDAAVKAVADSGRAIDFYRLNTDLLPDIDAELPPDTWLLYVNYFGLCSDKVSFMLENYPAGQLIIDNAHALFDRLDDRCVTIHSPRKFVGLPDGGILRAPCLPVHEPDYEDTNSLGRMEHLLIRASEGAQPGYASFREADRSLANTRPLRMSKLTRRLLCSIDFKEVRERRRENFQRLSQALAKYNECVWSVTTVTVPLCYPLVLKHDVAQIRKNLAGQGAFVPTYWEEVRHRVRDTGIEATLLSRCLPLPCDQRCTDLQIDRMIDVVRSELRSY